MRAKRAYRTTTMHDTILAIDQIQARRYSGLTTSALLIADEGIIRHLRACGKNDSAPDVAAIREIIDDAIGGRKIFAETTNDLFER